MKLSRRQFLHLAAGAAAMPAASRIARPWASVAHDAVRLPGARRLERQMTVIHPAAMVGTGTPKLRGRTSNEAIVMPTAPSLERDSAAGRRTPGN
jgi:hypothetical protein